MKEQKNIQTNKTQNNIQTKETQKNIQTKEIQKTKETEKNKQKKRVSMRFYLKAENSLKIEELVRILRERGWKKDKTRLVDLIIDALFLKADNRFYEEILNKLTPLEYLFKTKLSNPSVKKEIERILKKKVKES